MMQLLVNYLAVRRAADFKLRGTEYRLRSFVRFAIERHETHIRAETAIAWAGTACSPQQRYVRLRELVMFAHHLRAEDPSHELPSGQVYAFNLHRRIPHIYSDEEIHQILDAASQLGPAGSSRGDTYHTLFALLASTGLRISEAFALQLRDVTDDGLVIRNTKFRKSRLVPLHSTTVAALTAYCSRWRAIATPEDPLLVSIRGTMLLESPVHRTFDRIARNLGMRKDPATEVGRRPSPCVHDFRHTFATRALEACPQARGAINRHILALSTYLGHVSVANTYWYLHATPRLMSDIADACQTFLKGGGQ